LSPIFWVWSDLRTADACSQFCSAGSACLYFTWFWLDKEVRIGQALLTNQIDSPLKLCFSHNTFRNVKVKLGNVLIIVSYLCLNRSIHLDWLSWVCVYDHSTNIIDSVSCKKPCCTFKFCGVVRRDENLNVRSKNVSTYLILVIHQSKILLRNETTTLNTLNFEVIRSFIFTSQIENRHGYFIVFKLDWCSSVSSVVSRVVSE